MGQASTKKGFCLPIDLEINTLIISKKILVWDIIFTIPGKDE